MKIIVIGGSAKVGKSTLTNEIKNRRKWFKPSPEALYNHLVKNLFTKEIPGNAEALNFRGIITTRPRGVDEIKPFDISFLISSSSAPSIEKDVLIELPTDYIRAVIRLVFVGANYGLGAIAFEGVTTYLDSNKQTISTELIAIPSRGEDENAWNALAPLISEYDHANENDLLVEGVAATTERVARLELYNLSKKVIFIGYSDAEKYVQARIDYAKKIKDTAHNNYDWPEIQQKGEEVYRTQLLDEARGQVLKNEIMREEAEKFGFEYFDLVERSFEDHIKIIMRSV